MRKKYRDRFTDPEILKNIKNLERYLKKQKNYRERIYI